MDRLSAMKARVDKRYQQKSERKVKLIRELTDEELIDRIYKRYESAWKKLSRL